MIARLCLFLLLGASLLASACHRRRDDTPVVASVIGGAAKPADPDRTAMADPARVLMGATAQGLVRYDAAGQVEPALAERWIIIDDGKSYIFRIGDARWADGSPVAAAGVARVLRRAIAPGSHNPVAPYLSAVDEIVAMTPQVIEIRLDRPRPDLLQLFASPDLAIFNAKTMIGTGPMKRVAGDDGPGVLLIPRQAPDADPDTDDAEPAPERRVRLIGERAALALARYAQRNSDLVLGGSYRDWPILQVSGIADADRRIDPARGLFGLAVIKRRGFLAEPENRAAIAMAIDRPALLDAFRPGWQPVMTVLPAQRDSAAPPTRPDWTDQPLEARRATARARVAAWKSRHAKGATAPIRVALPDAPGGNIVWTHVAGSLNAIGLPARRVALSADADLRIVDEVAPFGSARWYLATACARCDDATKAPIAAAREAPDMASRSRHLAEADAAVTAASAYIPLAQPLRWSVVSPRLDLWQSNAQSWHPLNHLRDETN